MDVCSILMLEGYRGKFRSSHSSCIHENGGDLFQWMTKNHFLHYVMCQLERTGITNANGQIQDNRFQRLVDDSKIGWLFKSESERTLIKEKLQNLDNLFNTSHSSDGQHYTITPSHFLKKYCFRLQKTADETALLYLPLYRDLYGQGKGFHWTSCYAYPNTCE